MSHSYSSKGSRQYRYYVCQRAQQRGWQECPAPSVPAGEIERFVVDQIKCVGRDPRVIKETLAQTRSQAENQIERLTAERGGLCGQLRDDHIELGRLAAESRPGDPRFMDAQDRIREAERRITQIDDELAMLQDDLIDEREVAAALADFDALWECLVPREQARVIELLVERVAYDGEGGNVSITFRPSGMKALAGELAQRKEEAA
jgi:site-specific DNA recombinase